MHKHKSNYAITQVLGSLMSFDVDNSHTIL